MSDQEFHVLIVCTANLCRSPMAQFMLVKALAGDPVLAAAWRIDSAGTHASEGFRMHPLAESVLSERNVAYGPFHTQRLDVEAINASDLILTATREHRRWAVGLVPSSVRRTLTIRQMGRLAMASPGLFASGPDRGARLLANLPVARSVAVPVQPEDDDLADPMGGRIAAFRRCADVIEQSIAHIVFS